jgi:hypothetical protein
MRWGPPPPSPRSEAARAIARAGKCDATCEQLADAVLGVVLERVTTTIEAHRDAGDWRTRDAMDMLLAAMRGLGDTTSNQGGSR